ncbi:PRTRC system ParB family protein [Paraburkholderia rhizosphaerae]|uniref:PRTRC genetic system ParB family protein n=1 Tax=Paraburkholderia rhizosphaerae TaxID=480658 RepID=A0A4R8LPR7_9BURK|nr:PRTRC system ParB family protein [Paraburkholderia rhizosphaerae]TDY48302.1 PRTRC genetic system ParB family protein [Paraburkholderia rhizosphaerae]
MQQQPTVLLRHIKPGRNPRTYFDPKKMAELTESIRARGVDTPIIVRPLGGDDYELIAGGRRYRAALEAHGEDYPMPVSIRNVDDAEARIIALTENIQRDDMAPSEEAVAAAEIVGLCQGDRDEAARQMGWSRPVLDSRLALMNCTKAVLEALNTRQIKLGHAELLAALAKDKQDALLPVIVAEKRTVPELKKVIEAASCVLSSAIFDKSDCAACPHNSATQSALFGESIASGNCTNRACFNDKTEKQLEATAAGLREEFPVVRIVRAGDNNTRTQLAVDGANGVGEEQAKACHACQSYGVAVSGLPDSLGKIYRGQCFDTVCNMKKVAARINAEKAAAPATAKSDGRKPVAKSGGTAATPDGTNASVAVVAESDRVKTYRVALWRKALRRDIGNNSELARQYLTAIVLSGHSRQISDTAFRGFWERLTDEKPPVDDVAKAATAVQATSSEVQSNLLLAVTFAAIEGLDVTHLTQLCRHHKLDLKKHWKLSKDFLELITKSEMMVVADELGIRTALGDNFKKVFAKSKNDVIEALIAVEGFDYTGKVPKVLKF